MRHRENFRAGGPAVHENAGSLGQTTVSMGRAMRGVISWLLVPALLSACGGGAFLSSREVKRGWPEEAFGSRPFVKHSYVVSADPGDSQTVIGEPVPYRIRARDTLLDVGRHVGLGADEMRSAFPELDPWVPAVGARVELPTWWILPDGPLDGIVINLSEMRLYYYPKDEENLVATYPVGLGRDEWRTPKGRFRIGEKTVDPTWVIPVSIRKERLREKGLTDTSIAGGDPENPLGRYRMRLASTLYAIHGTNQPWGVGAQVSHGCIRLYPEDIEVLFPTVPEGTPVTVVDQPVKIGVRDGDVYVEVHAAIYDDRFDYRRAVREGMAKRGWTRHVDWEAVERATTEKRGVPVRVTRGAPLASPAGRMADASRGGRGEL